MKFFRKHPDLCEEVWTFGERRRKSIFRIKREQTFFVKGSGRVDAAINELTVTLDHPVEEAVLRYNWTDGLSAEAPVEIYPCDMGQDVRFIGIRPHGCSAFRIRYTKWP